MDSYLIRIYRRSRQDPEHIVGVVEDIDSGQTHAFHSLSDLCRALVPQKSRPKGPAAVKNPERKNDGRRK